MSEESVATNQSATEVTSAESTNQSTESATTTDTTNQNFQRELDDDWGLESPEEYSDEEIDDPEEEEATIEETQEEETEEAEEETETEDAQKSDFPTLQVNFLGQAYNLNEDDARRYAQIGMNAGRLQEKVDSLKSLEPLKEAIEVMALFQGRSTEDVIKSIGSMEDLKQREVTALMEDGHDQALAEELFDSRLAEARQKAEINRLKKPEDKGLTSSQIEQIERFSKFRPKEHADITAGKAIPEDVVAEWKTGTDLTTAWLIHENNEYLKYNNDLKKQVKELSEKAKTAEKELKKMAKNAENKAKAPTRKKGVGGGNGNGGDVFASWKVF